MYNTPIGTGSISVTTSTFPSKEDIIERLLDTKAITFREALILLGHYYTVQPFTYAGGTATYNTNVPSTLTATTR